MHQYDFFIDWHLGLAWKGLGIQLSRVPKTNNRATSFTLYYAHSQAGNCKKRLTVKKDSRQGVQHVSSVGGESLVLVLVGAATQTVNLVS